MSTPHGTWFLFWCPGTDGPYVSPALLDPKASDFRDVLARWLRDQGRKTRRKPIRKTHRRAKSCA